MLTAHLLLLTSSVSSVLSGEAASPVSAGVAVAGLQTARGSVKGNTDTRIEKYQLVVDAEEFVFLRDLLDTQRRKSLASKFR